MESFCLTFTVGLPGIGEPVSAVLCEDGDDVAVTADNRREYVDAYVACILNTSVEKQVWGSPCGVFSATQALGLLLAFIAGSPLACLKRHHDHQRSGQCV